MCCYIYEFWLVHICFRHRLWYKRDALEVYASEGKTEAKNCLINTLWRSKAINYYCKKASSEIQKQLSRVVLKKMCSENMQQIYRRTPMPKCDFNKVALKNYWNRTSAWVFSRIVGFLQPVQGRKNFWDFREYHKTD